eukprot:RCo008381
MLRSAFWLRSRIPQTFVEKIVQRYSVNNPPGHVVQAGDFVTIQPRHVMTHDNTSAVMQKFFSIRKGLKIKDPRQPVFTADHDIQNTDEATLKKYASIQAFAKKEGVDVYLPGRGIGHQIMVEEGYALPGTLVVASDSHSNMYGGLGALGTPVVRTDAAAIWATGCTWWTIPPVARVNLVGKLAPGLTGKDVIIALCGAFNKDEVLNYALEFTGPALSELSVDDRLTIANMSTEWGALAGVFPVDDVLMSWLAAQSAKKPGHPRLPPQVLQSLEKQRKEGALQADDGAYYSLDLTLDLSTVRAQVSGPNTVKKAVEVTETPVEGSRVPIQKAYLLSCTNGRASDLAAAAKVLKGKKVASGVEFYVAPASSEVQREAEQRGDWQVLLNAGAKVLPAGCGPCIGLGVGLLQEGETGISATNRNFKGRMGHPSSKCFLGSPAVVAASAVAGYITAPAPPAALPAANKLQARVQVNPPPVRAAAKVELLPGFPKEIAGNLVFCTQDNLNTDGIYAGKWTYREDLTPEQMAAVVMENYDPTFGRTVRPGDILLGAQNFGTGSSREQAATALKHRGIPMILAASYSETYKRNAFNNGYIAMECPELVAYVRSKFVPASVPPTVYTNSPVTVNFQTCTATFDGQSFPIPPLGPTAQELVLAGGLEPWVLTKL